jgi:curved DNA-binding protein CbpA
MTTKPSDRINYYEILEVSPTAAAHDVQKAYLRAKSTYSQDNPALYGMFSRDEAREVLKVIEEAFNVLSNPTARRSYDESLMRIAAAYVASGPMNTSANSTSPSSSVGGSSAKEFGSLPDLKSEPHMGDPSGRAALASHLLNDDIHQDFVVKAKPNLNQELAAKNNSSQGKTSLSVYTIDSKFDSDIAAMTEFDGPLLSKIRKYKNIPIEPLCEYTRIGKGYMIALETNDFKSLPAPVFVRGFLIQVGRALGLDANLVAASYLQKMKSGGVK